MRAVRIVNKRVRFTPMQALQVYAIVLTLIDDFEIRKKNSNITADGAVV